MQTRRLLLDPAIHEEFTRLKNLVEEKEKKIKELQDNVAAVNFTPSSKLGKMLMAKCRTLQEENEEIGTMASEGKIHELGMKIAVLKSQNNELRNQFDVLYKHMDGVTNDVERSNELVSILQEELEAKDLELTRLKEVLAQKGATQDAPVETSDDAGNGQEADSDTLQVKAES
ncbi:Protein arginine N-methyltransferase 1.5 [Zea mays]|nr:Protein arginine N-methyltransferase 1.5 [Zea mays]